MTLPLLLYAAASAYRSSEDAKQREADKQERIDLANTVYSYGTVLDDNGSPVGGTVLYNVNEHEPDKFRVTHNKFGINGTVEPIKQGDNIEGGFTVLTPGFGMQAARRNQLFTPAGDILPDLLNRGVKAEDIVQTGQFINNKYSPFPESYLKRVMPDDDAVVKTKTTRLRYIFPENPQAEFENTQLAIDYGTKQGFDLGGLQEKLITETINGDSRETTFTLSAIDKATDAANKADKPPLFAFSYVGEKPSYGFSLPGTSVAQTPAVMSMFDTDIGMLGLRTEDDLKNKGVDIPSYTAMLRNVAGSLLDAHSEPVGDTGKRRLDQAIVRDSDMFLQNQYQNLFRLPGFAIAFQDARDGRISTLLNEASERAADKGNTVRVSSATSETDPQVPPDKEVVIAAEETPAIKGPNDMLVDYFVSNELMSQSDANGWVTRNVVNYKEGSITELEDDQSKSKFINYLLTETVPGSNLRAIDLLASATEKTTEPLDQLEIRVMERFVREYGTLDDKINLLVAMNPKYSGVNVQGYQYVAYQGGDAVSGEAESFFEQNRAVETAYGNAERFLLGAINTYELSDGSITKLGAQAGQIALGFDGFFYMVDNVIAPAVEELPFIGAVIKRARGGEGEILAGSVQEQYVGLKRAAMGMTDQVVRFSDLTVSEQKQYLKERGFAGTIEQFEQQEAEARRILDQEFDALSRELVPSLDENKNRVADTAKEVNLKYAMRAYYRYMAAYALASATQGGTGGRTISDQDVLNFLKAFQTDSLLSNPNTEKAVLETILTEVRQQKSIAGKLAQGGPTAIATMKILKTKGSELVGLDMNKMAMNVLGRKIGNVSDNNTGVKPKVTGPTPAQILDRINTIRVENGEDEASTLSTDDPYYTDAVDELNQELGI